MKTPDGVTSSDIKWVKSCIHSVLPETKIYVFGSRLGKPSNLYADLDLAILSKKPISFSDLSKLKELFSEGPLLYKVDLVDLSTVDENFKARILSDSVEI